MYTGPLKKNEEGLFELQIGDDAPFLPDSYGEVGAIYGEIETTKPEYAVRAFSLKTTCSVVEWEKDHMYNKLYFRHGAWESGTGGKPRFHVWEPLE